MDPTCVIPRCSPRILRDFDQDIEDRQVSQRPPTVRCWRSLVMECRKKACFIGTFPKAAKYPGDCDLWRTDPLSLVQS